MFLNVSGSKLQLHNMNIIYNIAVHAATKESESYSVWEIKVTSFSYLIAVYQ